MHQCDGLKVQIGARLSAAFRDLPLFGATPIFAPFGTKPAISVLLTQSAPYSTPLGLNPKGPPFGFTPKPTFPDPPDYIQQADYNLNNSSFNPRMWLRCSQMRNYMQTYLHARFWTLPTWNFGAVRAAGACKNYNFARFTLGAERLRTHPCSTHGQAPPQRCPNHPPKPTQVKQPARTPPALNIRL